MTRHISLVFAVALSLTGCGSEERPNVLLITVDTLRADHLGCYGYKRPTSPNIDSLAAEGVLFEQAEAQAPWTLPSMASLLTSRYPAEIGMIDMTSRFDPTQQTLALHFREAGYETAAFVSGGYLSRQRGFDRGFDRFDELPPEDRAAGINAALREWAKAPRTRPFFAWVHYFDVHSDYEAPAPFDELFDDTPPRSRLGQTVYLAGVLNEGTPLRSADLMTSITLYDREIAYTDHAIGRVLKQLERSGDLDRTVVVVGSDHGEAFQEHGWLLHTLVLYEELTHVPLIIRYPKRVPRGRRVTTVVQNLDIGPTLLKLAGIPPPRGAQSGASLGALWRPGSSWSRPAFSHTDTTSHIAHYSRSYNARRSLFDIRFMMRQGADKIIYSREAKRYEIFDLSKDPGEKNNLYSAGENKSERLKKKLAQWVAKQHRVKLSPAQHKPLSPEEIKQLQSLGYIDRPASTDAGRAVNPAPPPTVRTQAP